MDPIKKATFRLPILNRYHKFTFSENLLEIRLAETEQMNRDWISYNDSREFFVQELTSKHHETANQLRKAIEEIQKLHECREDFMRDHNLRTENHYSEEMRRKDQENENLKMKNNQLQFQLNLEIEKNLNSKQQIEANKMTIVNLESVNAKIEKVIKKDRFVD